MQLFLVFVTACVDVLLLQMNKHYTIPMPAFFYSESTKTPKEPQTMFLKGYV